MRKFTVITKSNDIMEVVADSFLITENERKAVVFTSGGLLKNSVAMFYYDDIICITSERIDNDSTIQN